MQDTYFAVGDRLLCELTVRAERRGDSARPACLRRYAGTIYSGSEKSEAQTFLNELFTCYGTRSS